MFEGHICCYRNCLGNIVTGTDAVTEFTRRRKEATTQAQKQMLVDTFLVTFPGVCKAATQLVLKVGKTLIETRRKRLQRGEPPGPSEHGLIEYRKQNPMYRVEPGLLRNVNFFFDTYLVGNPVSETRRAHINAVVPVNGKQGLWKMFLREVAQIPQSTFNNALNRWLKFHGFTDLDRAHVDHNVCPTCRALKYKQDRIELLVAEARRALNQTAPVITGDENTSNTMDQLQSRLHALQEEAAALRHEVAKHGEFNTHCRSIVAWWKFCAVRARVKFDSTHRAAGNTSRSPARASVPLICIVHCDGEASRKIPNCRHDGARGPIRRSRRGWKVSRPSRASVHRGSHRESHPLSRYDRGVVESQPTNPTSV